MSRQEFAKIFAYVSIAIGKQLPTEAIEVYYDLLGDLDQHVLQITAKRVVLEHKWATFPSVAEFREAAAETMRAEVKELSPAEAWEMAWKAARRIDLEIDGSFDRACAALPPIVVEAMRSFSIPALIHGKEPVGVVRGQFLKIFEQLAARDRRAALLPDGIKRDLAAIGQKRNALPIRIVDALSQIGVESETGVA